MLIMKNILNKFSFVSSAATKIKCGASKPEQAFYMKGGIEEVTTETTK